MLLFNWPLAKSAKSQIEIQEFPVCFIIVTLLSDTPWVYAAQKCIQTGGKRLELVVWSDHSHPSCVDSNVTDFLLFLPKAKLCYMPIFCTSTIHSWMQTGVFIISKGILCQYVAQTWNNNAGWHHLGPLQNHFAIAPGEETTTLSCSITCLLAKVGLGQSVISHLLFFLLILLHRYIHLNKAVLDRLLLTAISAARLSAFLHLQIGLDTCGATFREGWAEADLTAPILHGK